MTASKPETANARFIAWGWVSSSNQAEPDAATPHIQPAKARFDLLRPVRHWLDRLEVRDRKIARSICQFIPSQCPFERNITLLGRTFHIPPMCKLNPVYDEVVALRFRALSYLADVCGEDVTRYC